MVFVFFLNIYKLMKDYVKDLWINKFWEKKLIVWSVIVIMWVYLEVFWLKEISYF